MNVEGNDGPESHEPAPTAGPDAPAPPGGVRLSPVTALIAVGLIVVIGIALALVFSGGGDDDPSAVPTTTPAASDSGVGEADGADGATPSDGGIARPDIEVLDCNGILSPVETTDAILELVGGGTGAFRFSQGETCRDEPPDDPGTYIQLEPGLPSDLDPGARLLGVAGEPVDGFWDAAAWFAGADEGVLAVQQRTERGILNFRIGTGRPGASPDLLRDVATGLAILALPRFPFVEVEIPVDEAERTVVTVDVEPVDPDPVDFLDNVVIREAEGDWTLAEGIAATLRFFLGEERVTTVIPATNLPDESGSGVIALGRWYANEGDDPQARSEIAGLLDALVAEAPRRTPDTGEPGQDEPGTAESDSAEPGEDEEASGSVPDGGGVVDVAFRPDQGSATVLIPAQAPDAEPEDPCAAEGLVGGFDDACWELIDVDTAGSEASAPRTFGVWLANGDLGPDGGWARADADIVADVIRSAVDAWGVPGLWPELTDVFLRASDPGPSGVALSNGVQTCDVHLHPTMRQAFSGDQFEQAVARQMAYCYIGSRFPDQTEAADPTNGWWIDALSIALSSSLYPNADVELIWLPGILEVNELSSSVLDRRGTNWVLFEAMTSVEAAQDEVIDLMPLAGGRDAHVAALDGISGFDQLFQRVARELSDGTVPDRGGAGSFDPETFEVPLAESQATIVPMEPLETRRLRVEVPNGSVACVEQYGTIGEVLVEWRQGEEGSPGGPWDGDLPLELTGTSIFVMTTTNPAGAEFEFESRTVEGDSCDEEDDTGDLDEGTLCDIDVCGVSEYYSEEGFEE